MSAGQRGGNGDRAAAGLRLRRPGDVPAADSARDLLGDLERGPQEVDAQTCTLTPAQAEHHAEVRHRRVAGPELVGQAFEIGTRHDGTGGLLDLGELDAAARRTADVVTLDREPRIARTTPY